ncbi:MAG: antitoxin Xre/MbcA/ParS toxin-binding domain-containing protein [Janthinobacterium lividum]
MSRHKPIWWSAMAEADIPVSEAERSVTGQSRRRSASLLLSGLSYTKLARAEPIQRINMTKAGIPTSWAKRILADLTSDSGAACRALRIPAGTLNRKARAIDRLPLAESERLLGCARLIGQVQAIVEESGDPDGFDAAAWLWNWLKEPLPALGGVRPLDMLDTIEGQGLVSATLARIQAGAYA